VLRLVGAPGIGKTMISSYLVEELEKRAQFTSGMIFAYYFCDNKDDKRNTAIAIIRGLLLQLLRQRPLLFKHIQEDYDQMRHRVFDNFDALWRILLKILTDPNAGQIYFLIDALDECDKSSRGFRQAFLASLADLFSVQQGSESIHVKLLITCRPESDILDEFNHLRGLVRIDSGKINADLFEYIRTKVDELSTRKRYPSILKFDIQNALSEKAGGTFLWVSLVLEDISKAAVLSQVRKRLQSLPSSLSEVYSQILDKIQKEDVENARFILQWVVTARRPLTVHELAMARALGPERWDKNTVPTADTLDELNDGFKICEPLVYLDSDTNTINLVHQSAKDYLLEENLEGNKNPSMYRIIPDKANSLIFQICWRYLSMEEFSQDPMIIRDAVDERIWRLTQEQLQTNCFLRYAIEEWREHALAASPAVIIDFTWESKMLNRNPVLRDGWLQSAAGKGEDTVVKRLLTANADVNAAAVLRNSRTALQAAAARGHLEVVNRLLTANADVNAVAGDDYGRTALQAAAEGGHLEVVNRLLTANADVNAPAAYKQGRTALQVAVERGHCEVVNRLLTANADVNAADSFGWTALQAAAERGHLEVVNRLLTANADVNAADSFGRTTLQAAAERGNLEVVNRLLTTNVDVNAADAHGRTASQMAAEEGYLEVVNRLLTANADVNAADRSGRTALHMAAEREHLEVINRLLTANVDVNAADRSGRTALHMAVKRGHLEVVNRLLTANADVNASAAYENGRTALQVAVGHPAVMRILQAAAESQERYISS